MKLSFPSPEQFWHDEQALRRTREGALAWARERHAERVHGSGDAVPAQAMLDVHLGYSHVDFFRQEMPQIIRDLPEGFSAVEVGAGMGYHAALLTAHGAQSVIATEITWGDRSPYCLENVSALHRIRQMAPELDKALKLGPDPNGWPTEVEFAPALRFARASAHSLPLPAACADLVYSWNCIEHIPDPGAFFAEAARLLRVGGYFFSTTEPLYYSADGHHLWDFFPLPWGHLLWSPTELSELIMREAGEGREWAAGEPLTADHLLRILNEDLNFVTPRQIRRALAQGPWKIVGWLDLVRSDHEELAREIGLFSTLRGVSREALLLSGVRFRLQRVEAPVGLRLPFRLSHLTRAKIRRLRGMLPIGSKS